MHDPFRGPGCAGRINDGGQVVSGADRVALKGTIGGDEYFPRGPIVRAGGGALQTSEDIVLGQGRGVRELKRAPVRYLQQRMGLNGRWVTPARRRRLLCRLARRARG